MAKPRAVKWSKLLVGKKKWDGEKPQRREVLELVKREIRAANNTFPSPPLTPILNEIEQRVTAIVDLQKRAAAGKQWASEFARIYIETRIICEWFTALASNLELIRDAYKEMLFAQLEVEGTRNIKLANEQSVVTFPMPHISVKDKEVYREWCTENGLEKAMHLPWQKTSELVTEMLENGVEEPPGVETYLETRIRVDKG